MQLLSIKCLFFMSLFGLSYANADSIIQYVSSKNTATITEGKDTLGYLKSNLNAPISSPEEIKSRGSNLFQQKEKGIEKDNKDIVENKKSLPNHDIKRDQLKKNSSQKARSVKSNNTNKNEIRQSPKNQSQKLSFVKSNNVDKKEVSRAKSNKSQKTDSVTTKVTLKEGGYPEIKNQSVTNYSINLAIPDLKQLEKHKSYSYETKITISRLDDTVDSLKEEEKKIEINKIKLKELSTKYSDVANKEEKDNLALKNEANQIKTEIKNNNLGEAKILNIDSDQLVDSSKEDITVNDIDTKSQEDYNVRNISLTTVENSITAEDSIHDEHMSFRLLKPKRLKDYPGKNKPNANQEGGDSSTVPEKYSYYQNALKMPATQSIAEEKDIVSSDESITGNNKKNYNIDVLENTEEDLRLYKKELEQLKTQEIQADLPNAEADYKKLMTRFKVKEKNSVVSTAETNNSNVALNSNQESSLKNIKDTISSFNIDELPLE